MKQFLKYSLILVSSAWGTFVLGFNYPWDGGHATVTNLSQNAEPPRASSDPLPDELSCSRHDNKASPIYLSTGYLTWPETDTVLAGKPGLYFRRTFNSHDSRFGMLGQGWTNNFEERLMLTRDSMLLEPDKAVRQLEYNYRQPSGKNFEFIVNQDGSITPPDGLSDYQIEPQKNEHTKLIRPDQSVTLYNERGQMVSHQDKNGNQITYEYDSRKRLIKVKDKQGRFFTMKYHLNGFMASITDQANRVWKYDYDFKEGFLTSVTNPDNQTRHFEYIDYRPYGDGQAYPHLVKVTDESGRVILTVQYEGTKVKSYTAGENRYQYTRNFDTGYTVKKDSLGSTWVFKDSGAGLIGEYIDPLGLKTPTQANPNTPNTLQFHYKRTTQYSPDGRITQVTNEGGHSISRTFDNQNRLTEISDARGTVKLTYQNDSRWPSSLTSPTGRKVEWTYNAQGDPLTLKNPAGSLTKFSWSSQGNLIQVTNALKQVTKIQYNAVGLPTAIIDPLNRRTEFSYNGAYNLIQIKSPNQEHTLYTYDSMDRVTQVQDPLGRTTHYHYDPVGRLIRVWVPDNSDQDAAEEKRQSIQFEYDAYGRLSKRIGYDGATHVYHYHKDNTLAKVVQPDLTAISYSYDVAKQLTQIKAPDETISYTYDRRGNLLSAKSSQGEVKYNYDIYGRVVSETNQGKTITYQYNTENELTGLTAFSKKHTYHYTNLGLLKELNSPLGKFKWTHDVLGRVTNLLYPNQDKVANIFNAGSQLTNRVHTGSYANTFSYQYDLSGRIKQLTEKDIHTHYQYDKAGQLIQENYDSQISNFSYDKLGNLLNDNSQYNSANQLTENETHTYRYHANGQLIEKHHKTTGAWHKYTWNSLGQLTQVERYVSASAENPFDTLSYRYGPLGRRIEKTHNGTLEKYVYSGEDRVATLNASNALQKLITFGPAIDQPLGLQVNAKNHYYHANHQGSIIGLAGDQQNHYQYTAFGDKVRKTGNIPNDFRYTAREYDADDLYYYRARYYDPTTKRFLSSDPIGLAGGLNEYTYVGNDPINFIDPDGLVPVVLAIPGYALAGAMTAYVLSKFSSDNIGCHPSPGFSPPFMGGPSGNSTLFPSLDPILSIIMESKAHGKGERGKTSKPEGTKNPDKKRKPHPTKPGWVQEKDPHTGKWKDKKAPPSYNN